MNDDDNLSDSDARAALRGELPALNRLATVATYRLVYFFTPRSPSLSDAEDMTQETLQRAFAKLGCGLFSAPEDSPAAALISWILGIGKFVRLEFFKKMKKEHVAFEEAAMLAENSLSSANEAEDNDPPSLLSQCVNGALDLLSEGDRLILRASHWWEMKDTEIAVQLEITHSAARKRLQLARKRFRELLEKDVRFQPRLPSGAGVRCNPIKPPTDAAA